MVSTSRRNVAMAACPSSECRRWVARLCDAIVTGGGRRGDAPPRPLVKPRRTGNYRDGTIPQLKGTPEEYLAALGKTSTKVMVMSPGDKATF